MHTNPLYSVILGNCLFEAINGQDLFLETTRPLLKENIPQKYKELCSWGHVCTSPKEPLEDATLHATTFVQRQNHNSLDHNMDHGIQGINASGK